MEGGPRRFRTQLREAGGGGEDGGDDSEGSGEDCGDDSEGAGDDGDGSGGDDERSTTSKSTLLFFSIFEGKLIRGMATEGGPFRTPLFDARGGGEGGGGDRGDGGDDTSTTSDSLSLWPS